MKQKQYIAAIEIGSSKIVGAVAEKTLSGQLLVEHVETDDKLINCVSYGCVKNVENVKSSINRIVRSLENSLGNGATINHVYVGFGGRSLHSEAGEVNRSIDASQSIQEHTINSIIADASKNGLKKYETINVVPSAYYVDKQLVSNNNPIGEYGSSIKIKFNLIVANPALMLNLKRVMVIMPNVMDKNYIITTLAMGNHILTPEEKRLGCMLVDMGAETTSVAIYKNGMLTYFNTLPLGGRNLTLDIATGLNHLEETAERVKKNIHNPLDHKPADQTVIETINSREAANYINARAGEIIANINKQFEYAGKSTNDISTIVLTGGAAELKGIDKKLEETTKVNVRRANMPANVNFNERQFNCPENVQIMSLLAEVARIMDPMDSCVDFPSFSDGPIITAPEPTEPEQPKQTVEQKPVKTKHGPNKPGFWDRLLNKTGNWMMNNTEEDEF